MVFLQSKKTIKILLAQAPFLSKLMPGWPDEARLIVQEDILRKLTKNHYLSGVCLNAGCGEGLYSEFLESFQEIGEIVNIDLELPSSPQKRLDPRHRAGQGSLTCLPFEDAIFDSCLCTEVIEHIEEDNVAVSELARVLKPGGLLLISVPTPPAPYDPAHVREGYTKEELSNLLIKNGFTIHDSAYCFHASMRLFYNLWQWQFVRLGKKEKSYMPRLFIILFGIIDKYIKIGKPWDLVILAQRI